MTITRYATASDADVIVDLLPQLLDDERNIAQPAQWRETLLSLLDRARGAILVAEHEGEITGIITVSYNVALRFGGEYAQIEELIVDSKGRGRGTGALLVNAAIAEARQRGCMEIGLYAREHNVPFYEKLGFVYTGPEMRQSL
ncbi:GNAT family N-acetyltransferase [Candidatus Entotheonella palauensis]|nr:GNAT family N-acetyltransferase [Candidatus Entotheonella palauensis]